MGSGWVGAGVTDEKGGPGKGGVRNMEYVNVATPE